MNQLEKIKFKKSQKMDSINQELQKKKCKKNQKR